MKAATGPTEKVEAFENRMNENIEEKNANKRN